MKARTFRVLLTVAFTIAITLTLFSLQATAAPAATTRYVSPTGKDTIKIGGSVFPNLCTQNKPCKTIKWAVEVIAASGDTVSAAAGTYVENIAVTKNLTIVGAGVRNTYVDGNAANSVFSVSSNASVKIKAMRIRNGSAPQGGGVNIASGSTLNLINVTLADNTASTGGAIRNNGTLTTKQVVLYRNHGTNNSGGGLSNNGTATLDQTDIQQNDAVFGAAVYNVAALTITNSAIHGNTALNGYPGIYNSGGTLNFTNVTISGNTTNSPTNQGGGISIFGGSATVNYVTITGNLQGAYGGVFVNSGSFSASNSIISGNSPTPQCGSNTLGAFSDGNYNVYGDGSCGYFSAKSIIDNPKLKPLESNGGFTQTHALKSTSPAIDLVPNAKCTAQDQRGSVRPVDGNGDGKLKCDAGAFEYP